MHKQLLQLPPAADNDDNEEVRALLGGAKQKLGFVPNMYRTMANAPHLLESYLYGYDRFRTASGFTPAEQEVVFLSISRENDCHYCLAAHGMLADKVSNVPTEVTDAIQANNVVPDAKLRALSEFTRLFVRQRGWIDERDLDAFLAAGYGQQHVLDILLAVSVKTISNYSNHLFATPIDEIFASRQIEE